MREKIWLRLMVVSTVIYIAWRLIFTIPLEAGVVSFIAGMALFLSEFTGMLEALIHFFNMRYYSEPEAPIIPAKYYPHVDVLIATHNEDVDLLFKTINGCKHMEYPDKSKVHIYLCDDGNRPEIGELADKMGIGYFPLANNKLAKAGNLNNALSKTDSPLILTLDADMIPRSHFLLETIPYFFLPYMIKEDGIWRERRKEEIDPNYRIGFVQTPQSFYNPDLFQFNFFAEDSIPNEQDYFFREVNIRRNISNSVIYAGSNTVISRRALADVGGIRTGTITEDIATGIDIQIKGYTCFAIKKVLASGLAPVDFASLVKQRQRWGRGSIQIIQSLNFWRSRLPVPAKISYLGSLLYWWTFMRRIVYILSPILYSAFGILVVKTDGIGIFCIWLPSYLIYNHTLRLLSGKVRDQKWSNIIDTIMAPYLAPAILMETFGIRMKSFIITSKERHTDKSAELSYAFPHIILLAGTVVGLYRIISEMVLYSNILVFVVLFWLLINGYFLLAAVFFMIGRVNYRRSERYSCKVPVQIQAGGGWIGGMVEDISEHGFALHLDFPEYLSGIRTFVLSDNKWRAAVEGQVVHVNRFRNVWRYSVRLEPLSFEDKQDYFQIVFDREPTLATEIRTTAIEDISNFFKRKTAKEIDANRKLPRLALDLQADTDLGRTVTVLDYNYEYISIAEDIPESHFSVYLGRTRLTLHRAESMNTGRKIYSVENPGEIAASQEFRTFLRERVFNP